MIEEKFKETLRKSRLYSTIERIRLFQELKDSKVPCSPSQLVAMTSGSMDESTVYRNLEIFEEIGITTRVYSGWKYGIELSDKFSTHHHHMTCNNCGEVISFKETDAFVEELKKLEKRHSFKSDSHSLELKGTCQNCT